MKCPDWTFLSFRFNLEDWNIIMRPLYDDVRGILPEVSKFVLPSDPNVSDKNTVSNIERDSFLLKIIIVIPSVLGLSTVGLR